MNSVFFVTIRKVCKKPKNISHVEAASLPYAGLTAYSALALSANVNERNGVGKRYLVQLTRTTHLRPVIDRVYSYEDLPSAYEKVSKGHARGKTVVKMD
uniref:Alcohol dehydrogenase-like C-terminal domain-containing protein n=1 Tax=Strigamia maritima TaxID=126957 RepID=T1JAF3_STRMM